MRNRVVVGTYAVSAFLPPLVLLLVDAPNWYSLWVAQYGLMFSVAAIVLGLAHGCFTVWPLLSMATAVLWLGTVMSFALWSAVLGLAQRCGSVIMDVEAALIALTALGLAGVAVGVMAARRGGSSTFASSRLLCAGGIAVLALYLAYASLHLYAGTRVLQSGGLAGMEYEARLRLWSALAASALLVGGTIMGHFRKNLATE